ncbi:MAG: type II secretion system minor pseudopilin GspJ [Gammaproteobacteria bacterium]|nr:type II secretion system minor pseudopilin GspJ [Gammaproteobacteria bacterium]
MNQQQGFTLLELLVAMAIFAIIGLAATAGLNAIIDQSTRANQSLNELNELQRAVRFLTTDLYQMHPRGVRDELGRGDEAALLADNQGDYLIRFSREGWRNPAGIPRSNIQRVQYRLEGTALVREYWPVLDHTLSLEPIKTELLNNVEDIKFEYLDYSDQWQNQWPPIQPGSAAEEWPRAVRLRLTLKNSGEIERLIEVAG